MMKTKEEAHYFDRQKKKFLDQKTELKFYEKYNENVYKIFMVR